MSQIGRELHLTLQAAVREAISRRHAYVTVEHLLFALLHDERGILILRHAGGDVPALRAALERFFRDDLEKVPGDEPYDARQTLAFHRVLQHALRHCESAEKEEVDAGDLVAAIFQEPDAYATALLRGQGISRLDVLQYISHGISKLGAGGDELVRTPSGTDGAGEAAEVPADPLAAFATDLSARAAQGSPTASKAKRLFSASR